MTGAAAGGAVTGAAGGAVTGAAGGAVTGAAGAGEARRCAGGGAPAGLTGAEIAPGVTIFGDSGNAIRSGVSSGLGAGGKTGVCKRGRDGTVIGLAFSSDNGGGGGGCLATG